MANQLLLGRALDQNGYVSAGAKATVCQTDTSTLLSVWTDVDGTVAAANPIIADGNGYWPQRFVTETAKVVITDADGVTLQTLDPAPTALGIGSAASEVSFSPTVPVPFTNVQAAIEGVAASVLTGVSAFGIGVTGNAPLLAALDATNIAAGVYRFDGTTTGTFPTGLVASDTGLVETWRQSSTAAMMEIGATTGHRVWRRRLVAGTWGAWRDVVSVGGTLADGDAIMRVGGEWVKAPRGYTWLTPQATTSGSQWDFTGIPAWATEAVMLFESCRTTTGNFGVRLRTSGAAVATGYVSSTSTVDNTNTATNVSTTSMVIFSPTLGNGFIGAMTLRKWPTSNLWISEHSGYRSGASDATANGGGRLTLAGVLDGLSLVALTGSGNQGNVVVGYR